MTPTWLHNRQTEAAAIRSAQLRRELVPGARVKARSLSGAGGQGTVTGSDEVLVYVRLDSGITRSFLPHALEKAHD